MLSAWTAAARDQRRRELSTLQIALRQAADETDRLRILDADLARVRTGLVPEEALAVLRRDVADADWRARAARSLSDAIADPVARLQSAARDLLAYDHGIDATKCPNTNIARLMILDGKNVAGALDILNRLVGDLETGRASMDPDQSYAAYKNRGWAYFALREFAAAASDLETALRFNSNGASAHCLLAKAKGEMPNPSNEQTASIKNHWQKCLAFAPIDDSVPAVWLREARHKIEG